MSVLLADFDLNIFFSFFLQSEPGSRRDSLVHTPEAVVKDRFIGLMAGKQKLFTRYKSMNLRGDCEQK
jgi:hypothetical protein